MGYKLNIRSGSNWVNVLKDLYVEVDNTNWTATTLSGFLDEVQTAIDGKKSRQVYRIDSSVTTSVSADAFDVILIDTSTAAVTATLPLSASLSVGDEVYICDVSGDANTNSITVAGNGVNVNGSANDLVMDVSLASVKLIYDGVVNGWHIDVGGSYLGASNNSINDPFLYLNADFTSGSPTENGGMVITRGDSNSVMIRWNEASDKWEYTNDGTTFTNLGEGDHGALSGLLDDDHPQYVHTTVDRTVTSNITFNSATSGAPFTIGANSSMVLVNGLNAEAVNGVKIYYSETAPASGTLLAGDIWYELEALVPE